MNVRDLHRFHGHELKCVYCGGKEILTVDHLVPKAWGGSYRPSNCVIACDRCNVLKNDMTALGFLEHVCRIVRRFKEAGAIGDDLYVLPKFYGDGTIGPVATNARIVPWKTNPATPNATSPIKPKGFYDDD